MTDDETPDPDRPGRQEDEHRRRDLRRAIIFGIVMATIQMAVLLYIMYG